MQRQRLHGKVLGIFKRARYEDNEKKKIKLSTNEQQNSYENAEICYPCKEKFEDIC